MRNLYFFICICCLISFAASAQAPVTGIIVDSASSEPLAFATVQTRDGKHSVITGINGKFSIRIPPVYESVIVSFVGYRSRIIEISTLTTNDTIRLVPAGEMNEVVIYSNEDKIRRIINTAVRNKDRHNPELYDQYQCNIYYKMHIDLAGLEFIFDSSDRSKKDTSVNNPVTTKPSHILFSETYSRRLYKRPQQVNEKIIASRFSGIKKTYFTNIITDVLPFHVYSDFISLNQKDYSNPIAKGWQQRYKFRLNEELISGNDTVFLMEFEPKNNNFNGLKGIVYINSDGYAISHFIGNTGDSTSDRVSRMEQIYEKVNGHWFPKELNYNFIIRRLYKKQGEMRWNGHSVVDSVSFLNLPASAFDKAHSVVLSDSVDLRSQEEWSEYRPLPITEKEANTYVIVDSFSQKFKMEKLLAATSQLTIGRLPVGKFDAELSRFYSNNKVEGARIGLGLYTNNRISKYYSLGGWAGYGTKDHQWKYGGSFTWFPAGNKENSVAVSYQNDLKIPGQVFIHNELSRKGLNNWLLDKVDKVESYAANASLRFGYWELMPEISSSVSQPLYADSFRLHTANSKYHNNEFALGLRWAYGEKRAPLFDYYEPVETKYPVAYLRLANGKLTSGSYASEYLKVLLAITYSHHSNRWGMDNIRIEGGLLKSFSDEAMPLSYLMAGNGIMRKKISYYSTAGFLTMRPYDYFSDQYLSVLYKHDFDKFFWDTKYSKPYLSLAHNLAYGSLDRKTALANPGTKSFDKGYHETGIIINQLLRKNLHFADVNFSAGAFHHWIPSGDLKKNTVGVFAVTFGF